MALDLPTAPGGPHPRGRAAGSWLSLSPDDFAITSDHDARTLVHRWTLKPGRTVPSGTFTFAGQYQHRPGRHEFHQDVYAVTASGGSGRPVNATRHF